MNYFQRLVLRAVRQPAADAANAVTDPFENTDTWPLEAVATELARSEPAVQPGAVRAESIVQREVASTTTSPTPVVPASPSTSPAVRAIPPPSSPEPVASDVQPPPEGRQPLPSAVASDLPPPTSALEAADRFMQAIGVRLPEDVVPAKPESGARNPTVPAAVAVADATISHRPTVQVITPPVPALLEPATRRMREAADEPTTAAREDARKSDEAPPRRTKTVVETRRVIVMGPASRDAITGSATGAGSPHYGLGQM